MEQLITIQTSLAAESLFVAQTQIDIREEGKNGGPEVTRYLKRVGLSSGNAWCMAFVYWCVDEAARKLSLPNPLIKTGGVMRQWNETKLRKTPGRVAAPNVKPGDIFIIDFGKGLGHTGFVENMGKGFVNTIEGNTNDEGSREGYEVARRSRPISSITGYIQL